VPTSVAPTIPRRSSPHFERASTHRTVSGCSFPPISETGTEEEWQKVIAYLRFYGQREPTGESFADADTDPETLPSARRRTVYQSSSGRCRSHRRSAQRHECSSAKERSASKNPSGGWIGSIRTITPMPPPSNAVSTAWSSSGTCTPTSASCAAKGSVKDRNSSQDGCSSNSESLQRKPLVLKAELPARGARRWFSYRSER
jgi:hypothetical protein